MAQARIGQDYGRAAGTHGRVVQGASLAVAVGGGRSWELRETAAAEAGRLRASLGGRM